MLSAKKLIQYALPGYVVGLIVNMFIPFFLAMAISTVVTVSLAWVQIKKQQAAPSLPQETTSPLAMPPAGQTRPLANPAATKHSAAKQSNSEPTARLSSEWSHVFEYIGTIEDMIILEGNQNNLDSEIVEKTLALLSRLNRVIPELQALNNSEMNHNIKRLVLRDLNGVITPFLSLSGEAKQKNRRILLNGLKDINSKITFYAETIERKDLLELTSKAELIRQRYNTNA